MRDLRRLLTVRFPAPVIYVYCGRNRRLRAPLRRGMRKETESVLMTAECFTGEANLVFLLLGPCYFFLSNYTVSS